MRNDQTRLKRVSSATQRQRKVNFFPSPPPFRGRAGRSFACRAAAEEHGLKKQHLPGRNSSESKTIVNVTQSQSCRLAVICGPLLPIPIHSVRMEFLDCFSSTLWLREIRQKFVFLPKRCHSKGAPVFRAALRGRGLKCSRGPEVIAGQWNTNYSLTAWYLHVVAITGMRTVEKCLQRQRGRCEIIIALIIIEESQAVVALTVLELPAMCTYAMHPCYG